MAIRLVPAEGHGSFEVERTSIELPPNGQGMRFVAAFLTHGPEPPTLRSALSGFLATQESVDFPMLSEDISGCEEVSRWVSAHPITLSCIA